MKTEGTKRETSTVNYRVRKDAFNVNVKELTELPELVSADLSGGTDDAVKTINYLKTALLELINRGKLS